MPRLPRVSARELFRAPEKEGFVFSRSKGSHVIYHHPETAKRVTVPYHAGRTIPPGTVANILREAGISRDDLQELLDQ
jgi:predicted RNA binding protein YcfA (HicA-like mRNA interferase family)